MLIMVIMAIMVNIVIMVIMVIMVIKVIVVIMVIMVIPAIIANSNFGSQCSKNLSKLLLERFWCSFTLFHPYVHLLEVTTAN